MEFPKRKILENYRVAADVVVEMSSRDWRTVAVTSLSELQVINTTCEPEVPPWQNQPNITHTHMAAGRLFKILLLFYKVVFFNFL